MTLIKSRFRAILNSIQSKTGDRKSYLVTEHSFIRVFISVYKNERDFFQSSLWFSHFTSTIETVWRTILRGKSKSLQVFSLTFMKSWKLDLNLGLFTREIEASIGIWNVFRVPRNDVIYGCPKNPVCHRFADNSE